MIFSMIYGIISSLFYVALHPINNGAFPKPLTPLEENRLIEQMIKGEKNARDTLIEHNLRLVAHIVKKYSTEKTEQDDLISIGTIGLIKGISTFNPTKGIKLATYVARCIENEILMHFRSLKKTAQDISINEPIDTDKDGNDLSLIDIIADDSNLIEDLDLRMKTENLKKYMKQVLTPRERLIISLRFGLVGGKEYTQKEVAHKLDISRSYVSRLEKKALIKLYNRFCDSDINSQNT
ncbi:MAG: RNA polymerase sporulation sigma factor SigK [Clostridia bacterium]|nr:RNA polymerase sporulation sigma factor SigK [Clostridia bacterium]